MNKCKNLIKLLFLLSFSIFIASCTGNNTVRKHVDLNQGATVFIENFIGDKFNIKQRLEYEFAKMGFKTIQDKEKSDYILKWQYTHAAFGTNSSVQLLNNKGETVYLGEGNNPGFGTLLNKTGATWGTFERALDGLKSDD